MKIKFGNVTFECCSVCPCGKLGLTRFDPEMGDVVDVYCLALNEITHKNVDSLGVAIRTSSKKGLDTPPLNCPLVCKSIEIKE